MPNIDQWSTDQVEPTQRAHSRGVPSQPGQARLSPTRRSASIVHPDFTLPAALDPEVIRLDKWIPLLCEMHH
jgi:hypothetical protein